MLESNHLYKDSTVMIHSSSTNSSLVVPSVDELDQELTYQQLTCLFLKQRKLSSEQKQELIKTQVQFQKFNKVFQRQIQYVERVENRSREQKLEFKKEKDILIAKIQHLEKVIKNICQRLIKVLEVNNSSEKLDTQKIESQNPEKSLGIFHLLDHLEKTWKENSVRLTQQSQKNSLFGIHVLELKQQTNLLKQQSKNHINEAQKLKQRLKMAEGIIKMAQDDKRRINDEWLQQIQEEKLEDASIKDFKSVIGAMKIEYKHLKRRNEELVQEIQELRTHFNEKLEILVIKVNRLEGQKNKEQIIKNRMRQFTT